MRRASLLVVLSAVAVPVEGQDMMSNPPLEFMAARRDLIVVAKVTQTGQPLQLKLAAPGEREPVEGLFRRYTLSVSKVVKQAPVTGAQEKARPPLGPRQPATALAPGTITVLAKSPPPGRPPVGDIWVDLRAGEPYVLLLRKMPDRPDYYLPAHWKNHRPASEEEVAAVERAANVDSWPWGKAQEGLQVALLTNTRRVRLQKSFVRVPGGPAHGELRITIRIEAVVALRNASDRAIRVNLYPADKCLKLQAAGPGGKSVPHDLYVELKGKDVGAFGPPFAREIAPGGVVFADAAGEADSSTVLELPLTAGQWTFTASYTTGRKHTDPEGPGLWTGQADSAPVEIEVQDFQTGRPAPGAPPGRPNPAPDRPGLTP